MERMVIVKMWGREVGRLTWDARRRVSIFTFHPQWEDTGLDISPLLYPLGSRRGRFGIYGSNDPKYSGLPPFIADSLPDLWGNRLFDEWRKGHKISTPDITALEKLSFIGHRAMGAFEFEPDTAPTMHNTLIDIRSLYELANRILADRLEVSISSEDELTRQALIMVGVSAGGRQPKALIAIDRNTGEIRSGQVDNSDTFDYYLLKFGNERFSAELEAAYYDMARAAGITMMESSLMTVDGMNHFLTRRFDRNGSQRLHTQTLAAMDPEADSYQALLMVCRRLKLPERTVAEVFRRMVFNILANNTDDHNKNFSFVMSSDGRWSLSPAYDLTFIFDEGGYRPNRNHMLMVGSKVAGITREDVLDFARENGVRHPEAIIKEVAGAIERFAEFAGGRGLPQRWIDLVDAVLQQNLKDFGFNANTQN